MRYFSYPVLAYPYWLVVGSHLPTHTVNSEISFPPINTEQLNKSAQKFQELMKQANLLMNKIVSDHDFAYMLMDAAQSSNQNKVDELIVSTGITIEVETKYTPSGIHLKLNNASDHESCCDLLMKLSW